MALSKIGDVEKFQMVLSKIGDVEKLGRVENG